ncbi:hypothetical protein [Microvirga roseola]|uniref:hypothetical protein n=1 Tax=Microvirga roseola TaxID=2883126 RepID=UPI001E493673|nr:hypothetical protein [Microvirga roseola]
MYRPVIPASRQSRQAIWLALIAASFLVAGDAYAQTQPQAVRLTEVKDLDSLDPDWIMGICNLPGLTCNKVEAPRLFERKTAQGSEYYAVMVGGTLAHLRMEAPAQWELLNRWSFAEHPFVSGQEDQVDGLKIHPALYPAGPNLWAVAVLKEETEGYAGGGAQFVTADFVALDPQVTEIGDDQVLFGAVPFSCSKIVRACFTPQEYKTSPHCHAENKGFLTLTYKPSSGARLYDWTATWHQVSWPAGAPKSARTTEKTVAALKVGKPALAPKTFPFCAGGPPDL